MAAAEPYAITVRKAQRQEARQKQAAAGATRAIKSYQAIVALGTMAESERTQ